MNTFLIVYLVDRHKNFFDTKFIMDDYEDNSFEISNSLCIKNFPSQSGPIKPMSINNSVCEIRLNSDIDPLQPLKIKIEVLELKTSISLDITLEIHNFNNQTKTEKVEESHKFSPNDNTFEIQFKKPSRYYKQSNGYLDDDEKMRIDFTFKTQDDNSNAIQPISYDATASFSPSYYGAQAYSSNNSFTYGSTDNSKELTGYVGLKNQGATCYMNAFLQSLFHLPAFRRLVYNIHTTGNEDPDKSIPLNLQRLFCKMQFSDTACSTKSLTKSFGWGDADTFTQHDVHEFCRVLMDNIERKLKGTELENSIANLFRGKFRSYIRCKKVNYESSHDEEYYDLQMVVKGCKDLQASFATYTEKEILDGDNQYQTDKYGKQDAEMGIEFLEYPKILHIHLRRFDYDYDYNREYKINDRFEFPEELILKQYLAEDLQQKNQIPSTFELFGVIIHMGSVYAGHYYAFLKTSEDPQWYEFNDTSVKKVDKEKAINDNFGGANESGYGYDKSYSAYILIYVRKDAVHEVFAEINENTIPQHLIDFMDKEKVRKEEKRKLKEEQKNQVKLTILTDKSIIDNVARGVTRFDSDKVKTELYLEKTMTIADVVSKVKETLSFDKIRLWKCNYYSNPISILDANDKETTLEKNKTGGLTVFAERLVSDEVISEDSIVVWVIFFFPSHLSSPLQYVSEFNIKKNQPVSALYPQINEKLGFPADTKLITYIPTFTSPKLIENSHTFEEAESSNDSLKLLIVQQELNTPILEPKIEFVPEIKDEEASKEEKPTFERIKDIPIYNHSDINNPLTLSYSKYVISKSPEMEILIFGFENPSKPLFYVQFNNYTLLNDLKIYITQKLGYNYDPEKDSVEIYKEDDKNPGNPAISPQTLSNSMSSWVFGSNGKINNIYVYYHQNLSEAELEKTNLYTIYLQTDGYNVDQTFRFRMVKSCLVSDLLSSLIKEKKLSKDKQYRFCEVYASKIYKELKPEETLLSPYFPYLLQIIPKDQEEIKENEMLINGTHAYVSEFGSFDTFGDPFFIKLVPEEKFVDFKKRLYSHLKTNLEPEKLAKVKFMISEIYGKVEQATELKDSDVVIDVVSSIQKDIKLYLLEEMDKKAKKASSSTYSFVQKEKPVIIHG